MLVKKICTVWLNWDKVQKTVNSDINLFMEKCLELTLMKLFQVIPTKKFQGMNTQFSDLTSLGLFYYPKTVQKFLRNNLFKIKAVLGSRGSSNWYMMCKKTLLQPLRCVYPVTADAVSKFVYVFWKSQQKKHCRSRWVHSGINKLIIWKLIVYDSLLIIDVLISKILDILGSKISRKEVVTFLSRTCQSFNIHFRRKLF